MYAGVDEAGRGPVLGPLVVAGVLGAPDQLPAGVDDSKRLPSSERARIADAIHATDELHVARRSIPADEINERMDAGETLDEIETLAFADVLDRLEPPRAVVDVVGTDALTFTDRLDRALRSDVRVQARKGADASDPMVGAASIVAKVARDRAIEQIATRLDADVGSGYPSDPATERFLKAWRERSARPPPHARTAWSTLERLGFGTRTLADFEKGGPIR